MMEVITIAPNVDGTEATVISSTPSILIVKCSGHERLEMEIVINSMKRLFSHPNVAMTNWTVVLV